MFHFTHSLWLLYDLIKRTFYIISKCLLTTMCFFPLCLNVLVPCPNVCWRQYGTLPTCLQRSCRFTKCLLTIMWYIYYVEKYCYLSGTFDCYSSIGDQDKNVILVLLECIYVLNVTLYHICHFPDFKNQMLVNDELFECLFNRGNFLYTRM